MVLGLAVKAMIRGAVPWVTWTDTVQVTGPRWFVAVRV
jgi:hypothetical protein